MNRVLTWTLNHIIYADIPLELMDTMYNWAEERVRRQTERTLTLWMLLREHLSGHSISVCSRTLPKGNPSAIEEWQIQIHMP